MGNYSIHIEGIGCHHNSDAEIDADLLAREFVENLKSRGHNVTAASFTCGSADDLLTDAGSGTSQREQLIGSLYRIARGDKTPRNVAVEALGAAGCAVDAAWVDDDGE